MADHYTAVIEITKSETVDIQNAPQLRGTTYEKSRHTKKNAEIARIVVRHESLAVLRTRVQAHLDLIDG